MKMTKIKHEMIWVAIMDIVDREKNNQDINIVDREKAYKLIDASKISHYACNILMTIHPIVVIKFYKDGKRLYKVIANERTLDIARAVLGEAYKTPIPVLHIKNKKPEVIRDIQRVDCVGSSIAYSICDRTTFKSLITRMKDTYHLIFPSLISHIDIAESINTTAGTLFNNVADIPDKNDSKNKDVEDEKHKDNFSERYVDVKVNEK